MLRVYIMTDNRTNKEYLCVGEDATDAAQILVDAGSNMDDISVHQNVIIDQKKAFLVNTDYGGILLQGLGGESVGSQL